MVTKFECKCGNHDSSKVYEYDGGLGYEALVCKVCGIYYDNMGEHASNEWSKDFIVKYEIPSEILTITMRDLVLKRIEQIRRSEHNFDENTMRWKSQNIIQGNGRIHISNIKFEELNDYDLLFLLERIIRRMSKQM